MIYNIKKLLINIIYIILFNFIDKIENRFIKLLNYW